MKITLKRPCNECPFRRKAPAGWLGPWTASEIVWYLNGGGPFACHKTIRQPDQPNDDPTLQSCAGAAQFLNNQYAISRDKQMAAHQRVVGKNTDVFDWPQEFVDHHESLPTNGNGQLP